MSGSQVSLTGIEQVTSIMPGPASIVDANENTLMVTSVQ